MEYSRASGVAFEIVGGRAVLLDPAGVELITLNAVGTRVWKEIGEGRDGDAIVGRLAARFTDVPRERLRADVDSFLAELSERGLVSATDAGG